VPSSNPSTSNPSTSKSASSGGARKPAAVGSKRGRGTTETAESQQQQQQQQHFSNSDLPGSASGAFRSPDPSASSSGAISLPTPHRRPRQISAGLLAAAAAAGGAEARAAQTVMEVSTRSTFAWGASACSDHPMACAHTQPATRAPGYVCALAGMLLDSTTCLYRSFTCAVQQYHMCVLTAIDECGRTHVKSMCGRTHVRSMCCDVLCVGPGAW
jgi:hypothetical protein